MMATAPQVPNAKAIVPPTMAIGHRREDSVDLGDLNASRDKSPLKTKDNKIKVSNENKCILYNYSVSLFKHVFYTCIYKIKYYFS